MAKVTPVLWKQKINQKGEHPIYVRIEADGRRQYFSLRIWIKPSRWNPKAHAVRKGHRRADEYNEVIRQNTDKVEDEIYRRRAAGERVTTDALKAVLVQAPAEGSDFLAYGDAHAERLRRLGQIGTHKRYATILRKLRGFTGDSFPFERLTPKFLEDYQLYMTEKHGNSKSTAMSNFKAIKALVNKAIREGKMSRDDDPFINFSLSAPQAEKKKLSFDEIEALSKLELKVDSPLWHARNCFLFSFFCAGVRFGDMCLLRHENVRGGRIQYRMAKTGTPKDIGLVPAAAAILKHYNGPPKARVFPLFDGYDLSTPEKLYRAIRSQNGIMNRRLKEMAKMAGIYEGISFHVSRHSFADLARKEGWDIYKISKALGHKDLKVTEHYLQGFDTESIDEEMGKLFGDES